MLQRAVGALLSGLYPSVRVARSLGIEAQRERVALFLEAEDIELVAEFTEVETGKGSDALDRRWPWLERDAARWWWPSSID